MKGFSKDIFDLVFGFKSRESGHLLALGWKDLASGSFSSWHEAV